MRRYMFLLTFTPDDDIVEFCEDDIVMAITRIWPRSHPDVQAFSQNGLRVNDDTTT